MAERCVLLASANAHANMELGARVLRDGGTALDAVEVVVRAVEDHEGDHTVGYGGYPNVLGDVELDASVMVGDGRRAGAVASLTGFRHPVSVARAVLERLPHVMLVGHGAALFADECGFERREMLTAAAERVWRRGLQDRGSAIPPMPPLAPIVHELVFDPEHVTGTVNVIARDRTGRLASAVSTSGWAWKYPGRVGDTGVIGAGNFCDDRYGAATCTGWGELAIRGSVAATVVARMGAGASPQDACATALTDLADPGMRSRRVPFHVLAMHPSGAVAGCSNTTTARFAHWSSEMDGPVLRDRTHVPHARAGEERRRSAPEDAPELG